MTPVYQTKFDGQSNALEACIATVTGIPLDKIPTIAECKIACEQFPDKWVTWADVLFGWLKDMNYNVEHYPGLSGSGYQIGIGDSPRYDSHAVVLFDGELFHDPHPAGGMDISTCNEFFLIWKNDYHQEYLEEIRVQLNLPAYENGRVSYVSDSGVVNFGRIVTAKKMSIRIIRDGEKFVYPAEFNPSELAYL